MVKLKSVTPVATTVVTPVATTVVCLPANLTTPTAAAAWCKQNGLAHFSQLVIGKGANPNFNLSVAPYATQASSQRKTVLLNNAMVGKTVSQYYAAAKAKGFGQAGTNNALNAIAKGIITLHLPK